MPSSVTSDIHDNKPVTFRAFALDFTRVLGAFREHALDEPFVVDPSYEKAVVEAREDLATFEAMTPAEADAKRIAEYEKSERFWAEHEALHDAMRARYDAMIARAEKWDVPEALVDFKKKLIEHLGETRDFDCPRDPAPPGPRLDLDAWRMQQRSWLMSQVVWTEGRLARARDDAAKMTAFVAALKAAVPAEGDPEDAPIGGDVTGEGGVL